MKYPDDWSRSEMGNLIFPDEPICYGVLKPGDFHHNGIPLVRIVDIVNNRVHEEDLFRISNKLDNEFKRSRLKGGELLVSIQRTVGRVALAPTCLAGANISRTIARVSIDAEIADKFYVRHWLLSGDGERVIRDAILGTTRDSLNLSALRKIEVPHPQNLAEQSIIAEVLSKVDQAIAQTESLIAKQQRIKTGLMQDLLTRGIDEHGKLRTEETHQFKDSPLGRIPVEWNLFSVDSLGEVVTGSTPSTSVESYYDGDIMFVSPKDISNTSELITQTEKTLSPSGLSVCRAVPKNSICTVCIGSTIGKIGLTKSQCATNQQVNTLIPHISEDAEMLLFAMRLFLRPQLRREAGLQAVPIVNKALFSKMILPFPDDPDEKTRARTVLSAASSQIDVQIAYSKKLCALRTALKQDLLTGKKNVIPLMENMEVCS